MVNLNLEKHRQKEIWLTEIEENMPLIDEEDNDLNDFQNVNYQDLIKFICFNYVLKNSNVATFFPKKL